MTLHFCASHRGLVQSPEGAHRSGIASKGKHLVVDFHCHVLTLAAEAFVAERVEKLAEPALMLAAVGADSLAHNNAAMLPKAFPKLTRVEQRLADMDAMGVDVQVISPSPSQYYYWADRDLATQLVKTQN